MAEKADESARAPTVASLEALIARIQALDNAAAESRDKVEQVARPRQRKAEAELSRVEAVNRATQQACRELQRSTKALEEEAARLTEESLTRRAKLTGKFDETIADITSKMSEQSGEVTKVVEENEALQQKLERFEAQYAATRKHWETEARAKVLEQRLASARLAEAEGRLHEQTVQLDSYRRQ
eukprot:6120908-Prymnesium_polylepis.1